MDDHGKSRCRFVRRDARIACSIAVALSLGLLLAPADAHALPRYAAQEGLPCRACHLDPGGGGMRRGPGSDEVPRLRLPIMPWTGVSGAPDSDARESGSQPVAAPPGQVTPWLAFGGDARLAYRWERPDRRTGPDGSRLTTNTFDLPQGSLYVGATVHENVTISLTVDIDPSFEAWGLFRLLPDDSESNLMVRAGRFMPPFGLPLGRDDRFTRAAVGLGRADRDTGFEVIGFAGPLTGQIALVNGTFGLTSLDINGSERRLFEKAVAGRFSLRLSFGPLRAEVGLGGYYGDNSPRANPLFDSEIPPAATADVARGVDEVRAGGFLLASLGPVDYVAELIYVRDMFRADSLAADDGYASHQELTVTPIRGIAGMVELDFVDPETEFRDNGSLRAGLGAQLFPWPYLELRATAGRTWSDATPTGGQWDVGIDCHVFM